MAKNSAQIFYTKKCLVGAINTVKNSDKEKYLYNGYEIGLDRKGSWSFNDDTAKNAISFGVDNSSSSHTSNLRNEVEADT